MAVGNCIDVVQTSRHKLGIGDDGYLEKGEDIMKISSESDSSKPRPMTVHWVQAIYFGVLHVVSAICCYKLFIGCYTWTQIGQTYVFGYVTAMLGIGAGAHRLWCHRSYKARWPLELFLLILNTMCGQLSVFTWARMHRIHHKFSEPTADPHDINRGFFFAHIGWLLVHRHPEVEEKGRTIDMSDLRADPLIMFQHKIYHYVSQTFVLVLPTAFFYYLWGGTVTWWDTFCFCGVFRYILSIHGVGLINSYAHYYGTKSYDKRVSAVNPRLITLISDERWHNYHHTFPWDYRSSEFSGYTTNFLRLFIDICAWLGLAYDLKTTDKELIKRRVLRTGDGSHPAVWGWGDKDVIKDYIKATITIHSKKTARDSM